MDRFRGVNQKWIFFSISLLCFSLLPGKLDSLLAQVEKNPLDQRGEKLKDFREKRDRFFKEDPHSPLKESDRKKFKGLFYYPIDIKYAMAGAIEKYPTEPKPMYVILPTSKGKEKKYVKHGKFRFKWDGKEYVLHIYRPLGGGELFLPFKDKTSETETYPKGRYLSIEPMPGGKVLIDFNRANNPFCQFNEKYTCPYAPEENWLDIVIRAGEKRFR
ncbi:MAG: DUF1684 domain-containing protein [Desulfobacterales bacterium]|nr:DUF1684 domain-containing protein [Desulfobacterales bacterium]